MAEVSQQARVLFCGDPLGKLNAIHKRISSVNKSNGPFDAVFCVGQFFPVSLGDDEMKELNSFFDGHSLFPVPLYFIGDYGEGSDTFLESFLEKKLEIDVSFRIEDATRLEIQQNFTWLRKSGVVDLQGLRVAYLAGKFSEASFEDNGGLADFGVQRRSDFESLVDATADAVDVLLTNEWPFGVLNHVAVPPAGIQANRAGSRVAAELVLEVKPRYHVSGSEGVFFARDPYMNENSTVVTRFVGLGSVGNSTKQKYLHALSLTPASKQSASESAGLVSSATPCPFLTPKIWTGSLPVGAAPAAPVAKPAWASKLEEEESAKKENSWRFSEPSGKRQRRDDSKKVCFDFVAHGGSGCPRGDKCPFLHPEGGDKLAGNLPKGVCFEFFSAGSCSRGEECRFRHSMEGAGGSGGSAPEGAPKGVCFEWFKTNACQKGDSCRYRHSMQAAEEVVSPCWFCLSSPSVDSGLVLSVGNHCYVALAKGALAPTHCILLPIDHFPSTLALPREVGAEAALYRKALREFYRDQGMAAVFFERFLMLKPQQTHCHIQVVPVPEQHLAGVLPAFEHAAEQQGFKFHAVKPGVDEEGILDELKRVSLGGNYFCVELPDGTTLMHGIPTGTKFPLQFGREVIAKVMGCPEKADWKQCQFSRQEELDMVEDFKKKFQAFDIM